MKDSELTIEEIHRILESLAKHANDPVIQQVLKEAFTDD